MPDHLALVKIPMESAGSTSSWKRFSSFLERTLMFIGIGGVIDNLRGWQTMYYWVYDQLSEFSTIQLVLKSARGILLWYKQVVDVLLFYLPDGIREHVMLLLFLFIPFGLKRLGWIRKYDHRNFEDRFVWLVFLLWIAIDINDFYFGTTGIGRNLAWGLGWIFWIYYPLLFFPQPKKRFWALVFCLFWSMLWIAGNATSSDSTSNNPTHFIFWTYPAILLFVTYQIIRYREEKLSYNTSKNSDF